MSYQFDGKEEAYYCKCGGLLGSIMAGDESAYSCRDCGAFWLDLEDWMREPVVEREFSAKQLEIIESLKASAEGEPE